MDSSSANPLSARAAASRSSALQSLDIEPDIAARGVPDARCSWGRRIANHQLHTYARACVCLQQQAACRNRI